MQPNTKDSGKTPAKPLERNEASPCGQEWGPGEISGYVHARGMMLIAFIQQSNERHSIRQHESFPSRCFFLRRSPNLRP
jgi:hypothetical protein